MSISSRFSVGIHILSLIELNKNTVNTSESIAESVNTNAAVIRKIMGMLKKADLITVQPGVAGIQFARDYADITLLDVYHAVHVVKDNELFSVHNNPNPNCIVGQNIQGSVEHYFHRAQQAMEDELKTMTIKDVINDIRKDVHS
ncbi:Rrf2 family transcriptional regulator [Geomicrobium sediminis]|uniref:Rrf2 family transcriptional regulator n=1 Tax=Geomicrobium sediminis TaxID=1347788 RepID=UPI001956A526|nr:Rrf2 family transcriptional regulator [Geomicrobium sediminis]